MPAKGGLSCSVVSFIILSCTLSTAAVVGEVFTSVHDMELLADEELQLLRTAYDYISSQHAKLRLLELKLEDISKVRPPEQTTEDLVGDPIKAYSLVRRLTREWPFILNLMVNSLIDLQDIESRLPKEEDFDSAMRGLMRLQEVYNLDTKQLTQDTDNIHLTALDCFEMGKFLFKEQKYMLAASWFKEALEKNIVQDKTIGQGQVLPHLYAATLHSGCDNKTMLGGAPKLLDYLMSEYPNYVVDKESAPVFKQVLSIKCEKSENSRVVDYYSRIYGETCRGIGLKQSSDLKCFYIHHNNPRLLIAPFKMEEQNLDPPVLVFHDVISDQEIEEIKVEFSKNRTPCEVVKLPGSYGRKDVKRTCDVGWVLDNATDTAARLTRRVGDMTNLNMETSEPNQVASYGLGGEYFLHYDIIPSLAFPQYTAGSRLATLMFYLNDVESGGHTVFPLINVAVKPVKGSAVFWFNIDHQSYTLQSSLHGGCPVLKGSKWVLNKWIHEGKQTSEMFSPVDEKFPKPRYYLDGIK